jgi:ABC-type cobalamin/Fe3+-siderophores transport system ATPase subunit
METEDKIHNRKNPNIDFMKRLIINFIFLLIFFIVSGLLVNLFYNSFHGFFIQVIEFNYQSKEISILIVTFLILFYYLIKDFNKQSITDKSKTIYDLSVLFLFIWYLTLRQEIFEINEYRFRFAEYSFISLKYLDFLCIPGTYSFVRLFIPGTYRFVRLFIFGTYRFVRLFIFGTYRFVRLLNSFISYNKKIENKSKWENDIPLRNIENENYGRKDLIEKIANEINLFYDEDSSFSVGIVGPWGSGKTTFVNAIKNKVSNNEPNLIIDFNPWQYPEEANLTRAFLKEIEHQLERYSYSTNRIDDYISQLFKNNINWWGTITNLFINQKSTQETHECIKEAILKSKRKFIIFIDDIDRLQAEEVYEVLTIIRNVGNLPNTVFVLAYDKDYLLKILRRKIYNPQEYLSKFFQVELSLSKISEITVRDELAQKLKDKIQIFQNDYISSKNEQEFENVDKLLQKLEVVKLIKNKRDTLKLVNAISVTWPILEDSLIFEEYFQLEILRMKYGNVYSKIKYRDEDFLSNSNDKEVLVFNSGADLNGMVNNANDRNIIIGILDSLFPNNPRRKNEKSVSNKLKFDGYFQNTKTMTVFEELDKIRKK